MTTLLKAGLCLCLIALFACNEETDAYQEVLLPEALMATESHFDYLLEYAERMERSRPAVSSANKAGAMTQTTNVFRFYPAFNPDMGVSKLHRNKNGVTANFNSASAPDLAGHAVTLWWVVFDVDMNGGIALADAGFAGGHVIGNNGKVHISARLNENDTDGGFWFVGTGLTDAENQEIHLVARSHGPVVQSCLPEQTMTFCAACDCEPDNGCPGDNTCQDYLAAIHVGTYTP